ncbi:hypothetical protein B0H14DRAFT_3499133 [Mycena olivaceomarginata]|nr:hypothetical protein B0H14DRAFT_3499133 [Mycena olivaceomarginata]
MTHQSVRGGTRILCWDANTIRRGADHPSMGKWVGTWRTKGRSRTTSTPTTSPKFNPTPPSTDSVSHVKENSVAPVGPRNNGKNGSNCRRTTRSILGRSEQPRFSPVIAAAPHLTTILHTDTSDAESVTVKTSGAPSTLNAGRPTRVMTSDPAGVLADQGHETGPLIARLALARAERARRGLGFREPMRESGERRNISS